MKTDANIWTLEMIETASSVGGVITKHTVFEFCLVPGDILYAGAKLKVKGILQIDYTGFGLTGPLKRVSPNVVDVPVDLTIEPNEDTATVDFTEHWERFEVDILWKLGLFPWREKIVSPADERSFEMPFKDYATLEWDGKTKNVPNPPRTSAMKQVSHFTLRKGSMFQTPKNKCYNITLPALVEHRKRMDCWAATATLMMSWKEERALAIDEFLGRFNPSFKKIYNADKGVSQAQYQAFLNEAGFKTSGKTTHSMDELLDTLRSKGPLAIVVRPDIDIETKNRDVHFVLVISVCGDGTDDGTVVTYVDPYDGKIAAAIFSRFKAKCDPDNPRWGANPAWGIRAVHF